MKKIIYLCAYLLAGAGLAACSSSGDGDGGGSGGATLTTSDLTGTWSGCENESGGSVDIGVTIDSSSITVAFEAYDAADCTGNIIDSGSETLSYTLGGSCTLDGTVAGITSGTELDTTVVTSTVGNTPGDKTYDCITVSGNNLYVSDDEADPAKDASAPDKRPTRLITTPFVKQ
ncbi:MAG TPA: hypothetical protein ENJ11_10920 [Gammaproteobacteria bacterium]|nr:hypothetical protein [Gammaproteobacteria bacterium]